MPPKKAPGPSKKTEAKKKEKVIEVSKQTVFKTALNMQETIISGHNLNSKKQLEEKKLHSLS